jgi:hypothetical protein
MTHKVYINYHEVQSFLEQLITPIKEEQLKHWFNKKLSHYLMTTYKNVAELERDSVYSYFNNQDVPVVIQKAVENKEKIYHFKKSTAFKNKMSQVVDYLKHLESKSVNIAGMPFDVAYEQSDVWHKSFAKPKRKAIPVNMDGLNLIKVFDNDCFLAELVSKDQFSYESKMMSHCVDSYYGRDYSKVLTYRTAENKPMLTIEVVDKHKGYYRIVQAKGFANRGFIPEEHVKNVLTHFHSINKSVSYEDCLIFGHLIDEEHPVIIMPEGSIFSCGRYESEIEFKCCVGIPKDSVFNGDLRLSSAQLPILQNITVHGDLMIDNSLIVAIMDTVKVTGTIYISRSLTSIVAPELQSKIRRD